MTIIFQIVSMYADDYRDMHDDSLSTNDVCVITQPIWVLNHAWVPPQVAA